MCGIAGIITPQSSSYVLHMERMIEKLTHRGPDGSGIKIFENCVLGHTRLSIIDHTTGHQPMQSSKSDKTIVFNGEIYGFRKIREKIPSYPFATTSDTEVILALYEEYGINCVSMVPGMFAYAIWDNTKKTLFASRDRFGEKPFYYAIGKNGEFIFASEIKAILATGLIVPEIDVSSLEHYLKFLYVNPNKTIFSNIHTLPPAHFLVFADGKITIKRYWTPIQPLTDLTLDGAVSTFRSLLKEAVVDQMVADVPVGAFLSGGLDSSTIVALASNHTHGLLTFSFGFGESINELPYALSIAERYKTTHRELTPDGFSLSDLLLKMAEVFDEPFADSSNIPTYLISKEARKHVKVILTGDGADELIGGYDFWYRPLLQFQNLSEKSRKDRFIQLYIRLLIKTLEKCSIIQSGDPIFRRYIYDTVQDTYQNKPTFFSDQELSGLCLFSIEKLKYKSSLDNRSYKNSINDALVMDVENYLPGDILVKTDRASMAHGLELRAPFLDMRVASFCLSLPSSLKITEDEDKILLRRSFEKEWTNIVKGRSKQGFGAPVELWLKDESVQNLVKKYLQNDDNIIFNFFSYDYVQKITKEYSYKLWTLLVLSIWFENMRKYIYLQ